MKIPSLADRSEQLSRLLKNLEFTSTIALEAENECSDCEYAVSVLKQARRDNANVYLIGNGGSAAIVSHAKTDLMNVGKLKAITLHESAIMTCMANDYGYEHVFSRQLKVLAHEKDILIAVSSSGASMNILNAVQEMREKNANIITLSGFKSDNPLRSSGDLNYWIDSSNYTLVEVAHLFLLHHMADCLK